MLRRILIGVGVVGTILALDSTDVRACGGSKRALTPAEQASHQREMQALRRDVQGRNIASIDKALETTTVSAADRTRVKELRARAAKLGKDGKLDAADRALRQAWRTLGQPFLYAEVIRLKC